MAVRINADSEGFRQITGYPTQTAWSMFLRVKKVADGGTGANQFFKFQTSAGSNYTNIRWAATTRYWELQITGSITNLGVAPTNGTWYDVAVVQNGTGAGTVTLYVGETGSSTAMSTVTGTGDTTQATYTILGQNYTTSTLWPDCVFDGFCMWNAALTAAEIERQRGRKLPVRFSDLVYWVPMLGKTGDSVSAIGDFVLRDLVGGAWNTLYGTPTVEDGAPIGWGGGIIVPQYASASMAPVLSLPGVQDITATSARPKVTLTYS